MTGFELKEAKEELEFVKDRFYDFPKETNVTNSINNVQNAIMAINELEDYYAIGTVEECREARERQRAKKPIYKHYEDKGEPPYVKIACPNGCRIQLYPVTEKRLAHEHVFCPKCGQKMDWSDNNDLNS